jgi:hypothetical protein
MGSLIPAPWGNGPVVTCGKDFVGGWEYLLLALKANDDYHGDEERLLLDARSLYSRAIQDRTRAEENTLIESVYPST